MTIRVEILTETNGELSVALYYEVPQARYNPLSADQSRKPAGEALTAQEVTQLKQGRLIEILTTVSINGRKRQELRRQIERLWRENAESARRQYNQDYSYVGRHWDSDGGWS